jgi:hypothetical protein
VNAATGKGIQQALQRRSVMRGENSNVHDPGWLCRALTVSVRVQGKLRQDIAQTVSEPDQIEEEIRYLIRALGL